MVIEMIKTGASKGYKKDGDNIILFSISVDKKGYLHAIISTTLKNDKKLVNNIIGILKDISRVNPDQDM